MKPENVLDVLKPQASYTPGQIKVTDELPPDLVINGKIVACVQSVAFTDEVAEANAQRLAHCWNLHDELLEACETVQRYIGLLPGNPDKINDTDWDAIWNQVRAAIRKAKGKL